MSRRASLLSGIVVVVDDDVGRGLVRQVKRKQD